MNYYRNLDRRITGFFKSESVLFFPDGYLAFVALLRNIIQEEDVIFIPENTDGLISDAMEIIQRHIDKLPVRVFNEESFKHLPSHTSRVVILGNGICENTVSIAPVDSWKRDLEELWNKQHIPGVIILNDSLGVGLLGENYRGTFEHFGITANKEPDINKGVQYYFSTSLSDVLGSSGGLLVGDKKWLKMIRRTEPSCCSRAEMPLSNVVPAEKAFELVSESSRHERLKANVQFLWDTLKKYQVPYESHPLLPFVLSKVSNPKEVIKGLSLRGCRVGITHFTRKPYLCIAVNAAHQKHEIEYLVQNLVFVLNHKSEQ